MYGKKFESMYDGTLVENWKALVTFQQMIVLCDSDGIFDMTPSSLSRRTGIPIEIISEGIKCLEKEDPQSRTPKEKGKRIVRLDSTREWGWEIVNHEYYKKLASYEDKKKADRERIAKKRKENKDVANCSVESQEVANVAHTNSRHHITDKDKKRDTNPRSKTLIPSDFEITDQMRVWFSDQNFQYIEIEQATEQFKDYWRSTGKMMKDWVATWRNGMRNRNNWNKKDGCAPISNIAKPDDLNPETRYDD